MVRFALGAAVGLRMNNRVLSHIVLVQCAGQRKKSASGQCEDADPRIGLLLSLAGNRCGLLRRHDCVARQHMHVQLVAHCFWVAPVTADRRRVEKDRRTIIMTMVRLLGSD